MIYEDGSEVDDEDTPPYTLGWNRALEELRDLAERKRLLGQITADQEALVCSLADEVDG